MNNELYIKASGNESPVSGFNKSLTPAEAVTFKSWRRGAMRRLYQRLSAGPAGRMTFKAAPLPSVVKDTPATEQMTATGISGQQNCNMKSN